jgi:hypothetical protein
MKDFLDFDLSDSEVTAVFLLSRLRCPWVWLISVLQKILEHGFTMFGEN